MKDYQEIRETVRALRDKAEATRLTGVKQTLFNYADALAWAYGPAVGAGRAVCRSHIEAAVKWRSDREAVAADRSAIDAGD